MQWLDELENLNGLNEHWRLGKNSQPNYSKHAHTLSPSIVSSVTGNLRDANQSPTSSATYLLLPFLDFDKFPLPGIFPKSQIFSPQESTFWKAGSTTRPSPKLQLKSTALAWLLANGPFSCRCWIRTEISPSSFSPSMLSSRRITIFVNLRLSLVSN